MSLPMRPGLSPWTLALLLLAVPWSPRPLVGQELATVTGRVVTEGTLTPLRGVSVSRGEGVVLAVTDRTGGYLLRLEPGSHTLRFAAFGFVAVEEEVTVAEGQTLVLDVTLPAETFQLQEIVVTGVSRWSEDVIDAPAAVAVVEQERIRDVATTGQLPLLVGELPGVHAAPSGIHDYNLNARGFNTLLNRRLLVLVDGRDVSLPILGNQEWAALQVMEDQPRIEMIRGPGSAMYGANAFNGVLNIVTPPVRDILGTRLSVGGGELSTVRFDGRHAALLGDARWGVRINAGYYRSDSWDRSRTDVGDLEREYEDTGFTGVASPAPGYELAPLNGQEKEGPFGLPGAATGTPDPVQSAHGSARLDYYGDDGQVFTAEAGTSLVRNQVFTTSLGRSQVVSASRPWARLAWSSEAFTATAHYTGRRSDDQIGLASGGPTREASSRMDLEAFRSGELLDGGLEYVIGGSVRRTTIDSKGTLLAAKDDGRTDEFYGLFGQLEYALTPALKVLLAARYDDGTLFDGQSSPKAGLVYSPSPDHAVRLTFNRAFQTASSLEYFLDVPAGAPLDLTALEQGLRASPLGPALASVPDGTLFTQSASVPVLALGNESLAPTRVRSFEAGYKGRFNRRIFVTLDGYYNVLRDFVTSVLPGVNPSYGPWTAPETVDAAARPGVEAAVIGTMGSGLTRLSDGSTALVLSLGNAGEATEWGVEVGAGVLATESLRLDGNYSHFRADVEASTFVEGDSILPNTPRHQGNITATYNTDLLRLRAGVQLVGEYEWLAGLYRGPIPASQTVDVSARYRILPDLSIGVVASNLFDQRRYHVFGGSVIGRRILAGVTWEY
jgi:outer membrane receptor for ferrienterochelin and colicins